MNRYYVLIIILMLLGVGWRIWQHQNWLEATVCHECEVGLSVTVPLAMRNVWSGALFDWRGIRINCPNKVRGCEVVEMLEAGDRAEIWGKAYWEVENTGWPRIVVDVFKVTQVERVTVIPGISYWWWVRQAAELQERIVSVYRSSLSEPYASLLAGIVLGVQSGLPPDLYEALVRTGTLHVVAASGYNISVIAGVLIGLLVWFLPRRKAVILAIGGVVGYVLLSGASPAVVRAGIMGSIAFLAQATGRESRARWSLWVSAMVMLFVWPWLLTSVSFQLSVAATAGILIGEPVLSRRLQALGIPRLSGGTNTTRSARGDTLDLKSLSSVSNSKNANEWFTSVGRDLSTTLAATLATLPVTLVVFGQGSWVAPLVNVLVLWLVPPIMAVGAMTGIAGLLSSTLGQVMAMFVYPLLWVFVMVVEWFGSVPGVLLEFKGLGWWFAIGWWLVLWGWWKGSQRGG